VALYMTAIVLGTIGGTYASVPLYKVFCRRTGFGGTTQRVEWDEIQEPASKVTEKQGKKAAFLEKIYKMSNAPEFQKAGHGGQPGGGAATWTDTGAEERLKTLKPVENGRLLTVTFDGNVSSSFPGSFRPQTRAVKVVAGETALAFFTCKNTAPEPVTGVATYNVFPPKAGLYFNKVQCFCFEEQRLRGKESVDMPVFFYVDPEFYDDDQLQDVNHITLSYTFFRTEDDDDEEEEEEEEEGVGEKAAA
jgi:cytochrome c oxidase assembly protein subunit 11